MTMASAGTGKRMWKNLKGISECGPGLLFFWFIPPKKKERRFGIYPLPKIQLDGLGGEQKSKSN